MNKNLFRPNLIPLKAFARENLITFMRTRLNPFYEQRSRLNACTSAYFHCSSLVRKIYSAVFYEFFYGEKCARIWIHVAFADLILLFLSFHRFETGGNNMSHAETSAYCRAVGNLQLRRHAVYGVWIVSADIFCAVKSSSSSPSMLMQNHGKLSITFSVSTEVSR